MQYCEPNAQAVCSLRHYHSRSKISHRLRTKFHFYITGDAITFTYHLSDKVKLVRDMSAVAEGTIKLIYRLLRRNPIGSTRLDLNRWTSSLDHEQCCMPGSTRWIPPIICSHSIRLQFILGELLHGAIESKDCHWPRPPRWPLTPRPPLPPLFVLIAISRPKASPPLPLLANLTAFRTFSSGLSAWGSLPIFASKLRDAFFSRSTDTSVGSNCDKLWMRNKKLLFFHLGVPSVWHHRFSFHHLTACQICPYWQYLFLWSLESSQSPSCVLGKYCQLHEQYFVGVSSRF